MCCGSERSLEIHCFNFRSACRGFIPEEMSVILKGVLLGAEALDTVLKCYLTS